MAETLSFREQLQKFGALGNCLLSRNAGYSYREDDVERGYNMLPQPSHLNHKVRRVESN